MRLHKVNFGNGIKYLNDEGKPHNPHMPTFIYDTGEVSYYKNYKEQNIVGPYRIHNNGMRFYKINGIKLC